MCVWIFANVYIYIFLIYHFPYPVRFPVCVCVCEFLQMCVYVPYTHFNSVFRVACVHVTYIPEGARAKEYKRFGGDKDLKNVTVPKGERYLDTTLDGNRTINICITVFFGCLLFVVRFLLFVVYCFFGGLLFVVCICIRMYVVENLCMYMYVCASMYVWIFVKEKTKKNALQ